MQEIHHKVPRVAGSRIRALRKTGGRYSQKRKTNSSVAEKPATPSTDLDRIHASQRDGAKKIRPANAKKERACELAYRQDAGNARNQPRNFRQASIGNRPKRLVSGPEYNSYQAFTAGTTGVLQARRRSLQSQLASGRIVCLRKQESEHINVLVPTRFSNA